MALRGFLDETSRVDLHRLDGVRRDPENVARVLRSLARNISTQASARAIAADVSGSEEAIDHHTVLSYVAALSRLFVIEDLPAWSPALRSRSTLRQAHTHHFVDPSLAVAALDADPTRLLRDIETLGLLFESLVVRDLRVYAQGLDANVYHYRDNTGLEADAIVQRRDGAWAAFEVKLGHQGDRCRRRRPPAPGRASRRRSPWPAGCTWRDHRLGLRVPAPRRCGRDPDRHVGAVVQHGPL